MENFQINCLDHVAIRVKDISASVEWYEKILGLKKYEVKEWAWPVFMLAGKTGIAIFPVKTENPKELGHQDFIKIDHFAFNVDKENFEKARKKYEAMNIKYEFQDHIFFHSIYTKDPDGHTVELTTLTVSESEFYE